MSMIEVGEVIPSLVMPPVNRTILALYAGASGDHNPIHIDLDVAKAAGMPDVFAQGMLSMAWLGRMLTDWQPQSKLRQFKTKFSAITKLRDEITCSGKVVDIIEKNGEMIAICQIQAANVKGELTLTGEALVAI